MVQTLSKGQIKPKADWRAVNSPKNQTNKLGFFAVKSKKAKKKKYKFVLSFFGKIYGAPICLQFYLTFSFAIYTYITFTENSNYWWKTLLEVIWQNIAGSCQQTFCTKECVNNAQQCCAFTSQANFPAHNLNFHRR